jgi:HK97 family phage portal protein
MSVLDLVAKRFGFVREKELAKRAITLISSMGGADAFSSSLTASEKSYSQLVDAYRSWVYTSIDRIAKSVATLKIKIYVYRASGSRGKVILPWNIRSEVKEMRNEKQRIKYLQTKGLVREEIEDHAVQELFANPNTVMTRFILWYETMVRMELNGSCGWYIPQGVAGIPGEVWPLPLTKSATLAPRISSRAEITGWGYKDGNVSTMFRPEEIIFHKYPHPGSPFKGMSPLLAQTEPYDIDLYISRAQRHLFENRAVIGLNLHTDQTLQPEQAKELMEFLNEQYAGVTRTGSNLVTHSGLKAQQMTMTNKDALVGDVAKYAREKLISAYDLSEGQLGLVSDVNRANMEALNETFVNECLKPKTMLLEENIESKLLPMYDEGLSADFQLPDVGSREIELKEIDTRIGKLITTVNEERELMGRDPVPWGELPWIPAGMVQFGTQEPGSPPPPPSPGKEQEVEYLSPWGSPWRR